MIVEFIGSTGSGKSTLALNVERNIAASAEVATPFDLIAGPLGLQRVINTTIQNIVCDLVGFPFFVCSVFRYKDFLSFSLRMLARHNNSIIVTLNDLRDIIRKIGMYELTKRYANDRIILVDEGTVHIAHTLFVCTNTIFTPEEIISFSGLVPLPDFIICVKAPVSSLVQRSLQRIDQPRELRAKNQDMIERYVSQAVNTFDQLVQAEEIKDRSLIMENPTCVSDGGYTEADDIARFILTL